MVLYTGYHPDRIYAPMKPIKYDIKTYLLTESSTSMVLNYKICRRRENIV